MAWEEFGKEVDQGPYKASWAIGKWVTVIIAIVIMWSIVFKPFQYVSKVTNIDNAIHNYEYFHKQSQSYKSIKKKVSVAQTAVTRFKEEAGPRKEWTYEDKTEYARLNTIADGLVFQCNDVAADYNAKTEIVNRSIFKTDSTHYKLQECL